MSCISRKHVLGHIHPSATILGSGRPVMVHLVGQVPLFIGTERWSLLCHFGWKRHKLPGCCMMFFCLGNSSEIENAVNSPEWNHYTANVLFTSTVSCKERRKQKTSLEILFWLVCRQLWCCLLKYFYSPKWLEHSCIEFTIKTQWWAKIVRLALKTEIIKLFTS